MSEASRPPGSNPLRDAAIALAKRGFPVFPITPNKKEPPLIKAWQKRATTEEELIRVWWHDNPRANIGINAGAAGLFVVDQDVKPNKKTGEAQNGIANWRALAAKHDFPVGGTLRSITPSGGAHDLYKMPAGEELHNTQDEAGEWAGIDSRGVGGYILAPPSIVGGKPYRWDDPSAPIIPLPAAALALFKSKKKKPTTLVPLARTAPRAAITATGGTLLDLVQADGFALTARSTNLGEGPCPWCKGEDRFYVAHGQSVGRDGTDLYYHCRKCEAQGDSVEWLIKYRGVGVVEAKDAQGVHVDAQYRKIKAKIGNDTATPAAGAGDEGASEVPPLYVGVLMSEVVKETVTWLWGGRIPYGKITVLDGNPGDGKTLIGCEIAARVTRGQGLPGDVTHRAPAGAVLVTLEDGLGDTIRGRLEAAGADLMRIRAIQTVPDTKGGERTFTLPDDVPVLEAAVAAVGARFVFLDPLMAMLGDKVNSYKDQDVRRALQPLARFAERTGVAVVILRHLNKVAGGNPLYRGGGSIGIIGTARCGFIVLPDPTEDGVYVLAPTKGNLGPKAPALRYSIMPSINDPASPCIVWKGESTLSSHELLAAHDDPSPRDDEPIEFLREQLRDGAVVPANVVFEKGKVAGYGEKTLRRASRLLGIVPKKDGFQGPWSWSLPQHHRTREQVRV